MTNQTEISDPIVVMPAAEGDIFKAIKMATIAMSAAGTPSETIVTMQRRILTEAQNWDAAYDILTEFVEFHDFNLTDDDDNSNRPPKPVMPTDIDANIFAIMGAVKRTLRRAGFHDEIASEFINKVQASKSYDEALVVVLGYVDF